VCLISSPEIRPQIQPPPSKGAGKIYPIVYLANYKDCQSVGDETIRAKLKRFGMEWTRAFLPSLILPGLALSPCNYTGNAGINSIGHDQQVILNHPSTIFIRRHTSQP
jgi:hypothetical protein